VLPAAAPGIRHQEQPSGRQIAERLIASFPTCHVAWVGRNPRQWRQQVLAYFDTGGVSNGGTEAFNLPIEKTRRLAPGFRNFSNYRPRTLLVADGSRPPPPTRSNHA
jgi:transposase